MREVFQFAFFEQCHLVWHALEIIVDFLPNSFIIGVVDGSVKVMMNSLTNSKASSLDTRLQKLHLRQYASLILVLRRVLIHKRSLRNDQVTWHLQFL